MERTFAVLGALSAFIAVAAGAFGAHTLRSRISAEMLAIFETGARYQMYHALALLGTALAVLNWNHSFLPILAGWLFLAGVVLFSGSLYLLVFSNNRRWGAVTPLGGIAFIAGWVCLALSAVYI